jgi:hypothetical protein
MGIPGGRLVRLSTVAVAGCVAAASSASAALPPYWQSAKQIAAIVNDQQVHDALKYEEPILSISTTGNDIYELKTERCTLTVTIVDKPSNSGMVGPQQFDVEVGQADCQ